MNTPSDHLMPWWRHQMETFSELLAICAGNSPVPVNSPHKGQWRGALMFSLICARINSWVNNGEAGDLRRHRGHYDVIVMLFQYLKKWDLHHHHHHHNDSRTLSHWSEIMEQWYMLYISLCSYRKYLFHSDKVLTSLLSSCNVDVLLIKCTTMFLFFLHTIQCITESVFPCFRSYYSCITIISHRHLCFGTQFIVVHVYYSGIIQLSEVKYIHVVQKVMIMSCGMPKYEPPQFPECILWWKLYRKQTTNHYSAEWCSIVYYRNTTIWYLL